MNIDEIAEILELLDFVNWDRLFGDIEEPVIFGWIDRDDNKKDFVVLDFTQYPTWFATSSKKYSKEIGKLLEHKEHSDCERVEDYFKIKNMIKLK